jgi:hypothetical protein
MRLATFALPFLLAGSLLAQFPGLTLPPSGDNQKAAVTQFIGPVKISIEYSSPAVHGGPGGKDRRGEIWGKLVPYGMTNLGFGHEKPAPWRAGANENTVFEVSDDVLVEGKPLKAGRYGLHFMVGKDEWTLILSKNSDAWGSFFYEESDDALRVTLKPRKSDYHEYLTYEFPVRKPTSAVVEMRWEDLAVGWSIQVEKIEDLYISKMKHELNSRPGFTWQGYDAAAQYTLQANTHLEQGLQWAEAAVSRRFIGEANFNTLSTKAQIQSKLGREADAKATMEAALKLPGTTALQIHVYGRQLMAQKRYADALAVFELNEKRNGDAWPIHVGLARGYSATGDLKKALEHAQKALIQAPDDVNKASLTSMIEVLKQGKPVAQ